MEVGQGKCRAPAWQLRSIMHPELSARGTAGLEHSRRLLRTLSAQIAPQQASKLGLQMIMSTSQQFAKEISALLQRVPRALLLLLKTNDCLRAIDVALGQVRHCQWQACVVQHPPVRWPVVARRPFLQLHTTLQKLLHRATGQDTDVCLCCSL